MDLPYELDSTELILTNPGLAIPYSIILAIFAIVGTVGNILIIGSMTTGANRDVVGNFFIVNLAICDIVVTAFINPVAIAGVVKGEKLFEGYYWACQMLGSVCIVVCLCSLLNIGAISINRYIFIVHNARYSKIYTKWSTICMCLLNWLLAYLVDMPAHLGWTDHAFDLKISKCLLDRAKNCYYIVLFITIGFILPLLVIICFYLLIFRHINASKKRLASNDKRDNSSFKSSMKQAKMMFIIFVCFSSCWLPYALVLISDRYDRFPNAAHLYGSLTAHLHASINFIIYGISNRKIRAGYERFLYKYVVCCVRRTINETDIGATVSSGETRDGTSASRGRRGCCCFGHPRRIGDVENISTITNTKPNGAHTPD